MTKRTRSVLVRFGGTAAALLPFMFLMLGCGPNEAILKSNKTTPQPTAERVGQAYNTVETEVEAMRTARFEFVFVIRRKDDEALTAEDKSMIRNATADANRRTLSGDGKAVIVGSNYRIKEEALRSIKQNFEMEDLSGTNERVAPVNANIGR